MAELQAAKTEREKREGPLVMGKRVAFMFATNSPQFQTFQDMLSRLGVKHHSLNVAGIDDCAKKWNWRCKFEAVYRRLEELARLPKQEQPEYFVMSDIGDVIINKLPVDDDIIAYGPMFDLLLGGSVSNSPDNYVFGLHDRAVNPGVVKHRYSMSAVFGTIEAGLRYYQETLRNDLSRDALLEEMVTKGGKVSPKAAMGLMHRQGPGFREEFDDQTEVKRMGARRRRLGACACLVPS